MSFSFRVFGTLIVLLSVLSPRAGAEEVIFQEDFDSSAENWVNAGATALLTHHPTGGPDGGAYVSTTFNFASSAAGDTPVLLRGHEDFGASGLAFTGDWIDADVAYLHAQVRHDAAGPLTFFARVSKQPNFPGAVALQFAPVLPNTWTELTFAVAGGGSPQIVTFEGSDWETIFSDVANVQFGISVPASLAGLDADITFELDKPSIATPEPASATLFAIAWLGAAISLRRHGTGGIRN